MKVLSILQPWASLVVTGHKTIETRSWATKYRGELLIHASMGKKCKKIPGGHPLWKEYWKLDMPRIIDLPFGAIIGKVNLIETYSIDHLLEAWSCNDGSDILTDNNGISLELSKKELAFGDYSPNRYAWLFSDPILFNTPIPAKGQLNLWNFDIESRETIAEKILNKDL